LIVKQDFMEPGVKSLVLRTAKMMPANSSLQTAFTANLDIMAVDARTHVMAVREGYASRRVVYA